MNSISPANIPSRNHVVKNLFPATEPEPEFHGQNIQLIETINDLIEVNLNSTCLS